MPSWPFPSPCVDWAARYVLTMASMQLLWIQSHTTNFAILRLRSACCCLQTTPVTLNWLLHNCPLSSWCHLPHSPWTGGTSWHHYILAANRIHTAPGIIIIGAHHRHQHNRLSPLLFPDFPITETCITLRFLNVPFTQCLSTTLL